MRRFSQRNSLVTLNDINITPLLDLAFVLLIIFVITTPLLEKGMELNLPTGVGHEDSPLQKKNIHTAEVSVEGSFMLDRKRMNLEQITRTLEQEFRANPKMIVNIRADKNVKLQFVAELFDTCGKIGVPISLRADSRANP
jgi:biopolymer transport protein ExbD